LQRLAIGARRIIDIVVALFTVPTEFINRFLVCTPPYAMRYSAALSSGVHPSLSLPSRAGSKAVLEPRIKSDAILENLNVDAVLMYPLY